jgi:hypothetical protein
MASSLQISSRTSWPGKGRNRTPAILQALRITPSKEMCIRENSFLRTLLQFLEPQEGPQALLCFISSVWPGVP